MIDLFTTPETNLLPCDGELYYMPAVLDRSDSVLFFTDLLETIEWQSDVVHLFGKRIVTQRKMAWFGDQAFSYTYSGTTRQARPWTSTLNKLKAVVEEACDTRFNSCLLNLYHSGDEGMSWHSDNERTLVKNGVIASLSLGAERKFSFKHRQSGQGYSLILEQGSLLLMKGKIQQHWLHALPKTKKVRELRINLTFRQFVE